jgi:hypothetical protein
MSDHSIATQHRQTAEGWAPGKLPAPTSNLPDLANSKKKRRFGLGRAISSGIALTFAGIVAVELAGVSGFSPMAKIGESFSRLFEEMNQGQMRVQICLAKQQEISQRLAKLESDYAEWRGTCGLVQYGVSLFDQSAGNLAGAICGQGSHEYFQTAINDLHASRDELGGCN